MATLGPNSSGRRSVMEKFESSQSKLVHSPIADVKRLNDGKGFGN